MKKAYDIDGVLLRKDKRMLFRLEPVDVIITGRSYRNAEKTIKELGMMGITNAVYFNPLEPREVSPAMAAMWKTLMIGILKIEEFFEDDQSQIDVIQANHPNVVCHFVSPITVPFE